mgnify:CR=1 FL=1
MKSSRVQLIPKPQKMANNVQRQGRSAQLVECRIYCADELLVGWKFANAQEFRMGRCRQLRECGQIVVRQAGSG